MPKVAKSPLMHARKLRKVAGAPAAIAAPIATSTEEWARLLVIELDKIVRKIKTGKRPNTSINVRLEEAATQPGEICVRHNAMPNSGNDTVVQHVLPTGAATIAMRGYVLSKMSSGHDYMRITWEGCTVKP